MIIPYVSSMTEDAMRAVPMNLREALTPWRYTFSDSYSRSYAGSIFWNSAAYILGISRAVGETMVVAIAAGMQPNLTWNPMEPAQLLQRILCRLAWVICSRKYRYQTILRCLTLLLITLVFNIIGHVLRKRYREIY